VTVFRDKPELLLAFRRGERAALEAVYKAYVDDVALLLRLGFVTGDDAKARVPGLRDRQLLLDALQEVFARAFQERARLSYDGLRPYRPFLLRIARNLRIDQLRTDGRERPLSTLGAGAEIDIDALIERDQPLDAASSPQAEREWQTLAERTQRYVEELDGEARTFVQLRFVDERSQEEVAALMGVSRRHVRTLEERIKAGLRRFLARSS
jgi:RNA polymerase sigma factor (sigma-70 family)